MAKILGSIGALLASIVTYFMRFAKLSWLLASGLICTVAIFGSYILVTLQVLWWPFLGKVDMLLPIKTAIITGCFTLLAYTLARIGRSVKSKDVESILAESVKLVLFSGFLYTLRTNISAFYSTDSFIYLNEIALPWESRVIGTFAIVLPIFFFLTTTGCLVLILLVGSFLSGIFRRTREQGHEQDHPTRSFVTVYSPPLD